MMIPKYIRGLNGLRGLAALMVFVHHAWSHANNPKFQINVLPFFTIDTTDFLAFGTYGVALFFCLSGFLLSIPFWEALEKHDSFSLDLKNYFLKRFYRIYPAFFVALLVYIFLHDPDHSIPIKLTHFLSHAFLIHNFSESTVYNPSAPMWSVATESQMYVILPVIFWMAWKVGRKLQRKILLPLIIFVTGGLVGIAFWNGTNALLLLHPIDSRLVIADGLVLRTSPLVGLASFCTGVMYAYFYRSFHQMPRRPGVWFDVAALATFSGLHIIAALNLADSLGYQPSSWPGVPLIMGLLIWTVGLSQAKWGIASILEWKPIATFGMVSYSFYLYHDIVLFNIFHRLPASLQGTVFDFPMIKGIIAFLLSFIVAWISYMLIEKRLTTWLQRLMKPIFNRLPVAA